MVSRPSVVYRSGGELSHGFNNFDGRSCVVKDRRHVMSAKPLWPLVPSQTPVRDSTAEYLPAF